MNVFDAAIAILVVVAAIGGYRLGFVTRVASWIGLGLGLFIGIRALPFILEGRRGSDPTVLLLITLGVIFLGAIVGQALGFALGTRLRPADQDGTVTRTDGAAGAFAGIVGVTLLIWLLLPLLADVRGFVAEQAHGSTIAQALDERLPDAPDSMHALRALIGEDNFPQVFDALRPTPDLGPPPAATGLESEVTKRVQRSVVKVEGIACNQIQDGTGFVAGPNLVVTNAHVVAGESETEVIRDDGSRVRGRVVAFDPRRDLALISAPGIGRDPLTVVESSEEVSGGVFGHPGGGPLRIAPFNVARRIRAVGRDIYGTGVTTRDVLEIRSGLRPGDSGSALVDDRGRVVGVAFAIAPDKNDVAYALATSELTPLLRGDLGSPVSTGPCTGEA